MRKAIGSVCYVVGGGLSILSLQLMINCELLGAYRRERSVTMALWEYLYQTSGNHAAHRNGAFLHWTRDIFLILLGSLIIRMGRELFIEGKTAQADKREIVVCPACGGTTFADAYCRFCGFNLVTLQPSDDYLDATPTWQISLVVYTLLSIFLLIVNLILIKLGWS
jgi:hypothetical protein